jgi:hypothetical protein
MISNSIVQAAIISKLKGNSTIVATLNSSNEIKESQWQGVDFLYPAVRVNIGTQSNDRRSPYCNFGYLPFSIRVFSEQKSSLEADNIMGIINNELHGSWAVGTAMILNQIECIGLIGAIRIGEQLWQSQADYFALLTKH